MTLYACSVYYKKESFSVVILNISIKILNLAPVKQRFLKIFMYQVKSYCCVSKRDSTVVYAKVMNEDLKFGSIKCF